ncbi:hypothetical protein PPSIR1_38119 [Plesiocystis pacifica SIR-1]|uniref:Uncharacterized protein n=1 Tax=Plesiocystis pacifica SIR-1 TaxID=391625 RepID=A6GBQ3_9BACT|nr:SpvB/TcaC N-terminal domain-containing protein [Plesiocystis pacifica]EDM76670.1 hypothetical protein PPSIR1_38119 [Plesiocystis pacifica SIR-1]
MSDYDIFGAGSGDGDPQAPRPGGQQRPSPWGASSAPGADGSGEDSPFVDKSQFGTQLELPKGGGAVRGMGETFEADMFTGSAGLSVPLALSPGRAGGLAPSLALSYSSGSGNGPFGHGWSLGLPVIARKTERGLPRYRDDSESEADVFVLAGAEDLVPERDAQGERVILEREGFRVHRYRPRVEGAFARIERWVEHGTGRTHWRTLSRDNVHSLYGRDPSRNSTVHDPERPERVFRWLLDEVRDDRGHVVVYEYAPEDRAGVDGSSPAEATRGASTAQRYPARIFYGNGTPHVAGDWLFEVVFDYGGHGEEIDGELAISPQAVRPWALRPDAFSSFRPGFDLRTRRLCRRVLMFHRIPELDAEPYLVAATVLSHREAPSVTRVDAIAHVAYEKNPDTGRFVAAEFPALRFRYSESVPERAPKTLEASALEGLPTGIDGAALRFVDLHGEGLPGILAEHGGAWFYKRNLGSGRFGPPEVLPKPTAAQLSAGAGLSALEGAGPKLVVDMRSPLAGYVDRRDGSATLHPDGTGREWGEFVPFAQLPTADLSHPEAQRLDLAGDGLPDLLIPRGEHLDWYRSAGKRGFEAAQRVPLPRDQHGSPRLIFRDPQRAVLFADMSGDGLADLVCISSGGVHYWPNLGYGRFGVRTAMGGDTLLDHPDQFSPARVKLVDLDGTGPSDLIYLGARGCFVRKNLSGNTFSSAQRLNAFPLAHAAGTVDVIDLEGRGTACLVWSSPLGAERGLQLRYLDLNGPQKPNLLVEVDNNRGLVTRTHYEPSTTFYLRDRAAGRPWATSLPYPVQLVARVETHDQISQQKAVRHYAYHHGYHDAYEREFRGFGMVETWDTESFEAFSDADASLFSFEHAPSNTVEEKLHQPPVHTKTWMHTGAFAGWQRVSAIFSQEYYAGDPSAFVLPDSVWPDGLTPREAREAARALRGRVLRSEVYALDGDPIKEPHPYTVSEANFALSCLQPKGPRDRDHGVFLVHSRETLTTHYDREPTDPRVSHGMTLEVDDFGTVLRSAALVYPRRPGAPDLHPEQSKAHVTLSEASVAHDHGDPDRLRLGIGLESKSFELLGVAPSASARVEFEALRSACASALEVPYTQDQPPPADTVHKRLLGHGRVRYYADDLSGPLPEGQHGVRALPYDSLTRALDESQFTAVFGALDHAPSLALLESEGGYRYEADNGGLWLVSGHTIPDPALFYAGTTFVDPFGNQYTTTVDAHALLPVSASSPLGHTVHVQNDYRLLSPWEQTDINGTRSQVAFDTRGVVVKSAILGPNGEGDTLDEPTAVFEYELFRFRDQGLPNRAHARARETHGDPNTAWQHSYAYFGGAGQTILVKAQAEPGPAPKRDADGQLILGGDGLPILEDTAPNLRWIGNGRAILDNKGQVLRQYEPYFSSTHEYEDEAELVEQGVSPLMHYDPIGRVVRTDLPNGTFSKVETTPWTLVSYDPNDTVADSSWYAERIALPGATEDEQKEKRAAQLAFEHRDTPSRAVLDSLGRPFLAIDDLGDGALLETRAELDIRGLPTKIIDARGNIAEQRTYGFLGQLLSESSVDAGSRWGLTTIAGEPLRSWDQRGQCFRSTFDALRRPVDSYVHLASGTEVLLSRTLYGDALPNPDAAHHRGRVYRSYGGGGQSTVVAYDFKGLPTRVEQRLLADPQAKNDWTALAPHTTIEAMAAAAALSLEGEDELLASESTHDALGRLLTALSPDGSTVTYAYNQRGLLASVDCHHRGAATASPVLSDLTYDVHGRQTRVARAANATVTTHDYDPLTFRLRHILTTRTSDGERLQDLRYHYDPVGNITDIRDHAQQTVFFQNQVVHAANSYVYDPLYRLVEATGREHASQGTSQRTHAQLPPDGAAAPMANDPNALRRYTQRYSYDGVGNLTKVQHLPSTGSGWTRHYQYATTGNRLVATSAPGDSQGPLYSDTPTYSHSYAHDAHGNLATMPHLQAMAWDELEQLHRVEVGSQTVYCQYAGGQRVRKFVVHSGSTTEERVYVGAIERYRKRVNGQLEEEWQTLHVGGALVETRTVLDGAAANDPTPSWRFQLSNHLGSATTEVSETGAIISHEEYHPYGTSAYRMVDSQLDVPPKRYRFTGMERDEETGLSYHSARYYAPWLGRWTAADPIGLGDGVNRFAYVRGNPTNFVDPTGFAGESENHIYSDQWGNFAERAYQIGRSEQQLDQWREEAAARESLLAVQLLSGGKHSQAARDTLDFLATIEYAERDIAIRRQELWQDIHAARRDANAANIILRSGFQIEAMSQVTAGIAMITISAFAEAPTGGASTVGIIEGWALVVQGATQSVRGKHVEDGIHVMLRASMENNLAGADPDEMATLVRLGLGFQATARSVGSTGPGLWGTKPSASEVPVLQSQTELSAQSASSAGARGSTEVASAVGGEDSVPLYRAVEPAELADIQATGEFRNPYGIEVKYFSTTLDGAAEEAKLLHRFSKEPMTIVETSIPRSSLDMIPQGNTLLVDGAVPTVVLPTDLLQLLSPPSILNYTPLL